MKIGKEIGRKMDCADCPNNIREIELEKLKSGPGKRSEKAEQRKELLETHRCVGTCDAPIVNTPIAYKECRRPLCAAHATEPQVGHHRCREHSLTSRPA